MAHKYVMTERLNTLLPKIRACRVCLDSDKPLPHEPRPVVKGTAKAVIRIIGQAPGTRVHASGIPFDDPSGDRLRDWMGVTPEEFYDEDSIAVTPMGFCFPGLDAKGGDMPPRKECAPLWQDKLTHALPNIRLNLITGQYAQRKYLGKLRKKNLTETVRHWRDYGEDTLPLPHPSWRNNAWIKRNLWFEETLSDLKKRIRSLV